MKYKMVFSYNGRDFNGYQIQDGVRTVQEDIETLLHSLFQENIRIYSSGRTDRGVHAINQVASFKTVKYFEPNKLKYVMNRLLTKDIHIKSIEEVDDSFHARFSACGKKYVYKMAEGENDPLLNDFCYFYEGKPLDIESMKKACSLFIGRHNFMNFCSNKDEESYEETIYKLEMKQDGKFITFTFIGSGFKRYMVRIIVGTILAVGKKRFTLEQIEEKLNSKIHQNVSFKVPPEGLYLEKVYYEGEELI